MSEKLPVFATLGEAFVCLRRHWKRILPYVVALIVALLALVVIAVMVGAGAMVMGRMDHNVAMGQQFGTFLIFFVLVLGFVFLVFPVSNSLYRLAVQGEEARFGFGYGREEWITLWAIIRLSGAMLGLMLIVMIPILIITTSLGGGQGTNSPVKGLIAVVFVPFFICFFVLMFRMLPLLPAAANGISLSLRGCFRMTKGNTWRLFALVFLGSIPFSLVQQGLMVAMPESFVAGFVGMAISLLSWVFNALVVGLVYKHFREGPVTSNGVLEDHALPDPVI